MYISNLEEYFKGSDDYDLMETMYQDRLTIKQLNDFIAQYENFLHLQGIHMILEYRDLK